MSSTKNLTPGLEADMAGNPCPPMLLRWLGTLPNDLLTVLQTLANDGAGAWLVGGCVRDAWLGDPSSDIDVCARRARPIVCSPCSVRWPFQPALITGR